ncbi:MAG: hypothetical protein FWE56_03715 [Candidatus Bathyarchaeota archaeon]|nr:hypothetical protein [Candidatus Termiticorpusculum sp.]
MSEKMNFNNYYTSDLVLVLKEKLIHIAQEADIAKEILNELKKRGAV